MWARQLDMQDKNCIIFDALLVEKVERAILISAAKQYDVRTIAVWMQTPLHACLSRNASRPSDEIIPKAAVQNVFSILEPPTREEGFFEIVSVPFVETDT